MSFDQLATDAQTASQYTGVGSNVLLSQMVDENGWDVPSSYNFGNIQYYGGKDQVGYFTGANGQKFAVYGSEKAGLQAYVNLINSNYGQIAQAKGDAAQIQALQASQWDAGHYQNIQAVYNSVIAKGTGQGGKPMQLDLNANMGSGSGNPSGSPLANVGLLEWVLIGIALIILIGVVI